MLLTALMPYCLQAAASDLDIDTTSTNAGSHLVFNSIHDSMRQLGSSINYESRCAFIATVPAGVKLYHGTSKEEPPRQGLKWLAFEPEHSMLFSHPSEHWSTAFDKTATSGDRETEVQENHVELDIDIDEANIEHGQISVPMTHHDEERLLDDSTEKQKRDDTSSTPSIWQNFLNHDGWGYLHTYTTTRPLRLLYLDGTSAAKTTLGTLDLQDKVILQNRFAFSTNLDDDNIRAAELCRVAREDWEGRIDGFLRMETGFEIITCEVAEAGVESRREDTVATQKIKDTFATYKALAQRFDGIGGGRVTLDYDKFVTFHGVKDDHLSDMRAEIDDLVMAEDEMNRETGSVNWQAVTDMIMERFAAPLKLLSSEEENWDSKEAFDGEAGRLLLPFIDHRQRNRTAEVTRCAAYFEPGNLDHENLASSSIAHISQTICHELLGAIEDDQDVSQAVDRMRELVEYLDWSIWKDCAPACTKREVCYVPVWPFSLALDKRRRPECVNEDGFYALATEEILAASIARKKSLVDV
jgi:hypothetical protein